MCSTPTSPGRDSGYGLETRVAQEETEARQGKDKGRATRWVELSSFPGAARRGWGIYGGLGKAFWEFVVVGDAVGTFYGSHFLTNTQLGSIFFICKGRLSPIQRVLHEAYY